MTTFVMIFINSSPLCVIGFRKDLITFFNFTMSFSCLVQTANDRSWCMLGDVVGSCHLICIFSYILLSSGGIRKNLSQAESFCVIPTSRLMIHDAINVLQSAIYHDSAEWYLILIDC